MVAKLGDAAQKEEQHNVAFLSNFVLGKTEHCLELLIKAGRLPEAAFFARTYLPNQISRFLCSLLSARAVVMVLFIFISPLVANVRKIMAQIFGNAKNMIFIIILN